MGGPPRSDVVRGAPESPPWMTSMPSLVMVTSTSPTDIATFSSPRSASRSSKLPSVSAERIVRTSLSASAPVSSERSWATAGRESPSPRAATPIHRMKVFIMVFLAVCFVDRDRPHRWNVGGGLWRAIHRISDHADFRPVLAPRTSAGVGNRHAAGPGQQAIAVVTLNTSSGGRGLALPLLPHPSGRCPRLRLQGKLHLHR
ncbi:MAG: hypothetical protein ACI8RZ_007488 [Myxococcota bacterium]|jgi:hypothetical protein